MLKNVLVLVLAAGLGAYIVMSDTISFAKDDKKGDGAEAPAAAQQAVPVSTSNAMERDVVSFTEFSGRLKAAEDVQVRPRVGGQIDTIHFKEGDLIQKGTPLFTLDLRPYKAAVEQAKAALAAAEARASLAYKESQRATSLFEGKAYSQRELDEKKNGSLESAANVQAAKAALTLAQLNLEFAEIKAPITGRVGRPEITVGNIVDAGGNAPVLTTIQSIDPIYADFDMDEAAYLAAVKAIRTENKTAEMPVFMALADETEFKREGRVKSFDNQLMGGSGTLRVRAEFSNSDDIMTPGLFARIRLGEAGKKKVVVINDAAIGTDQDRRFVYVVDDKGAVSYRPVTLGTIDGGLRIITSGLKAGEKIVVNGLQRVHPGVTVQPNDVDMVTLTATGQPDAKQPSAAPAPDAE